MTIETIDRKPVFDAVRAMLGRSFTDDEIKRLDTALDKAIGLAPASAQTPAPPAGGHVLGKLSERFESGGLGAGAVSSGAGDPGGVSYGIWQLASKTGTATAFIGAEGAPWRSEFAAGAPGSPAFSAAWKAIAAREPERFTAAQHAFIKRSHYSPAVAGVLQATGLDLDTLPDAVRDATWSVSVQHGKAKQVLIDAVAKADAVARRSDPGFAKALVNAIYDVRTAYVLKVGANSGSQTTMKTMRSIAQGRYVDERKAALEMLK